MDSSPFAAWADHFSRNPVRQRRMEAEVDWTAVCTLPPHEARAIAHSFQRFALGESGDGTHLLRLAAARGDAEYSRAVGLLVAEEQRHSALFLRGLEHLGVAPLRHHWSDAGFTLLRRALGLDTEIALFLVAETVALDWFEALAAHPSDPVIAGIGRRILTDEREHIRFQVDRLHLDLRGRSVPQRAAIAVVWSAVAVAAATVLAVGHAPALRACGRTPASVWRRGLRTFGGAVRQVLTGPRERVLGPSVALPDVEPAATVAA